MEQNICSISKKCCFVSDILELNPSGFNFKLKPQCFGVFFKKVPVQILSLNINNWICVLLLVYLLLLLPGVKGNVS